jgi:hypothetical protein
MPAGGAVQCEDDTPIFLQPGTVTRARILNFQGAQESTPSNQLRQPM